MAVSIVSSSSSSSSSYSLDPLLLLNNSLDNATTTSSSVDVFGYDGNCHDKDNDNDNDDDDEEEEEEDTISWKVEDPYDVTNDNDDNDDDGDGDGDNDHTNRQAANRTLLNFWMMSIVFSLNHSCVVACLSVATARLGSIGAWQNGLLYIAYSISAIVGSTHLVRTIGSHNALLLGMVTYSLFVACFWNANHTVSSLLSSSSSFAFSLQEEVEEEEAEAWRGTFWTTGTGTLITALLGALLGGFGAELMWTAHGLYFNQVTEEYARFMEQPLSKTNAKFAQIFAFLYFTEEIFMRSLFTVLLGIFHWSWDQILQLYTTVAVLSTIAMVFARDYSDATTTATTVPISTRSMMLRQQKRLQQKRLQRLGHVQEDDNDHDHDHDHDHYHYLDLDLNHDDNNNDNDDDDEEEDDEKGAEELYSLLSSSSRKYSSRRSSFTASKRRKTFLLSWRDPKVKYMIGLNVIFGFSVAFVNSYVNGEVVQVVLNDYDSKYVGILSAWVTIVQAIVNIILGILSKHWTSTTTATATTTTTSNIRKGPLLMIGCVCFLLVVVPFIFVPNIIHPTNPSSSSGWMIIFLLYTIHGTGRACFEGNLKALFSEFFHYNKEGAYATILIQNGCSSAIGYICTYHLYCFNNNNNYCIPYKDTTYHDGITFPVMIAIVAIVAMLGYCRAANLHYHQ